MQLEERGQGRERGERYREPAHFPVPATLYCLQEPETPDAQEQPPPPTELRNAYGSG